MNSELLARLMAADPAERQWLLLESVLESLSEEVRQAVWAIAVPHWFDDRILAALCPEFATQAAEIYQELQRLSFVEVFEGRGHNIHEATRSVLLDRLWNDRPDEFKFISARAAEYFADDAENVAEWLYHKSVGEPIGDALVNAMEPLGHNSRRSESEVILKGLDEQIKSNRGATAFLEGIWNAAMNPKKLLSLIKWLWNLRPNTKIKISYERDGKKVVLQYRTQEELESQIEALKKIDLFIYLWFS